MPKMYAIEVTANKEDRRIEIEQDDNRSVEMIWLDPSQVEAVCEMLRQAAKELAS